MEIIKTKLNGVFVLKPKMFFDDRGFFLESYSERTLKGLCSLKHRFVQDNHSLSLRKGTLRGLHYQKPPHTQTKIVRAVRGSLFDVAVDLRADSKTYGKWFGQILSAKNNLMMIVPRGFAHGFCTLEDNTECIYKCDAYYNYNSEDCIHWNDSNINIVWPVEKPIISEKDTMGELFSTFKSPF